MNTTKTTGSLYLSYSGNGWVLRYYGPGMTVLRMPFSLRADAEEYASAHGIFLF